MKQILQNLRTGQTSLTQVPCPQAKLGQIVIRTQKSLIAAGTERMLIRRLRRFAQINKEGINGSRLNTLRFDSVNFIRQAVLRPGLNNGIKTDLTGQAG